MNPGPHWQPLEQLPLIASHITEALAWSREHYATIQHVKSKPYVFDNATVSRILTVVGEQQDDLWLFDEQLRRWQQQQLTQGQQATITELTQHMKDLHTVTTNVLNLAHKLKERTIEKALAKDEAELGLGVLLGEWDIQE